MAKKRANKFATLGINGIIRDPNCQEYRYIAMPEPARELALKDVIAND